MTERKLARHYEEFAQSVSPLRLERYLIACHMRKGKAIVLYKANLRLSGSLWGILSVFEVALRNAIDNHYTTYLGTEWLRNACNPGGYLSKKGCEKSRRTVLEMYGELGEEYSHGRLVAKLGLGFWKAAFAVKEFQAANSVLLEIFPNRPFGLSQRDVFRMLTHINVVRNRIAHHDPICFDGRWISTARAAECYHNCLNIMNWLDLNTALHLTAIDFVEREIAFIESLSH